MMIKTRPMMLALGAVAALGLAGCASDSASMEKESTDYIVTGLGDVRFGLLIREPVTTIVCSTRLSSSAGSTCST